MVTHAGLSTVMTALAAGVPMVCMPMGRDQPLNAQRVGTLGLGIELSPEASADAIRDAVEGVLGDGEFQAAGVVDGGGHRRLRKRGDGGPGTGIAALTVLLGRRALGRPLVTARSTVSLPARNRERGL